MAKMASYRATSTTCPLPPCTSLWRRAMRVPKTPHRAAMESPDGNAGAHRRPVGKAGDVAQAAHALADGAEARLVFVRPGLAEAGEAQHDQARVEGGKFLPGEAQFFP